MMTLSDNDYDNDESHTGVYQHHEQSMKYIVNKKLQLMLKGGTDSRETGSLL